MSTITRLHEDAPSADRTTSAQNYTLDDVRIMAQNFVTVIENQQHPEDWIHRAKNLVEAIEAVQRSAEPIRVTMPQSHQA
jgi:hypothetical protein